MSTLVSQLQAFADSTHFAPARQVAPGMGQAVAERTVFRKKADGTVEVWDDVAQRVAVGNASLVPESLPNALDHAKDEFRILRESIGSGALLMSGRHLQHGDITQTTRNLEVYTNCASAMASFAQFSLLLNGAGVGRSYDDDMMVVNWDNAPNVRCVMDEAHADFSFSAHESLRDAKHKYIGEDVIWHTVEDSREGWAKAIEVWETLTFQKINKDKTLVLDFSMVRPKGAPIAGMQGRPSSGPVPLMNAIAKVLTVKGSGMRPWLQSMYVDHYLAECVLVGGARRAARMAMKFWKDRNIFGFIDIKRPIEFKGKTPDEIAQIRKDRVEAGLFPYQSFLWSSNNSVMVDEEFWGLLNADETALDAPTKRLARHAKKVFQSLINNGYGDGNGEPGIINVDRLAVNNTGLKAMQKVVPFESAKYKVEEETEFYLRHLMRIVAKKQYSMGVNPCAEIAFSLFGAFCVIADVVPFHCEKLEDVVEVVKATTRALMRVNLMDSVYNHEVKRTNRIGVGLTGVHEFAWKFFQVGFNDMVSVSPEGGFTPKTEKQKQALKFWEFLGELSRAAVAESERYAAVLGVEVPHTTLTCKPSGTVSKLFGLTEGWHLPSMAFYQRWVQFIDADPLIKDYEAKGYQVRKLTKSYRGNTIVGFPTKLAIGDLGMEDELVFAGDASPEDQYKWLMLGERYWLKGMSNDVNSVSHERNNQISYTLKIKPNKVSIEDYGSIVEKYQSKVAACSIMPQDEDGMASFEYLPEQPLSKADYEQFSRAITESMEEDIGREHVDCGASGACPIVWKDVKASDSA